LRFLSTDYFDNKGIWKDQIENGLNVIPMMTTLKNNITKWSNVGLVKIETANIFRMKCQPDNLFNHHGFDDVEFGFWSFVFSKTLRVVFATIAIAEVEKLEGTSNS
jgi:hypothetical protein